MTEQEKRIEELLRSIHKTTKKLKKQPYKLEADEQGRYLLDPNNPHHVAWYENDDEYEIISEDRHDI